MELKGSIRNFPLPDVIQFIGSARRTGLLLVTLAGARASIFFEEGTIVHADYRDLVGQAVVNHLFHEQEGSFQFLVDATTDERNFVCEWMGAIMEAARVTDESANSDGDEFDGLDDLEGGGRHERGEGPAAARLGGRAGQGSDARGAARELRPEGREDRAGAREMPGDETRPPRFLHQSGEIHLRLHRHRPGPPGGRAVAHDCRGAASLAGERLRALPRRSRPRLIPRLCLLLVPLVAMIPAAARAQEHKVSLIFTGELLSMIATDNQGEQSGEIVDRIIGLSPAVLDVRLQRAGGRVSLQLTASGADELPVSFQFTLDKMIYYRMRTARADITGMTEALQAAKAAEPLLREVGYRYDGRYSVIDLTVDLRPAIKAAREMQARRDVEERAAAEAKAAAAARAAEEARVVAAAKAAVAARAKAVEEARAAAEASRAAAAAPVPEAQPRPASREAAPPTPAKGVAYLSARGVGREGAPVVDGQPSDPAWQAPTPLSFEVAGASGRMTVTAEALWSPDRLWVLVRWPDKTRDDVHRPWVWSKGEKAYVAGREVEDALALSFDRDGRMGECMLAGGEAASDVWTWRAGRTDPSGYAEDATLTLSFQRIARANSYQTRSGRSVWIKEEPDSGSQPYQAQIVGAYAGDRIPRYIARTPSGSMADVAAKGSWRDGFWTVEFSRRLSTGDPGDVLFAPGREILFSLAVFNSREGIDHSTSKELTLKLE